MAQLVLKVCLAAMITGAWLSAQTPTTAPPKPDTPKTEQREVLKPRTYVRRISAGVTLNVIALPLIKERNNEVVTTSPLVDAVYATTPINKRIGYGATVTLALTGRFALNGSLFLRRIGYKLTQDIHEGVDNPNTVQDERRFTAHREETRAKLAELPVVLRFYGKDRHEEGPRWFFEAGGALRRVRDVRTSVSTTIGSASPVCCDVNPAPFKGTVKGVVAGFGVHLIDPIGIRVIPEVRYTRWMGETFHRLTTVTERNQVEIMLSIGF